MPQQKFTEQELITEHWKPIPLVGFEHIYSVSSLGRIRRDKEGYSARVNHIMTPCLDTSGYLHVQLSYNNYKKHGRIARLVATAFLGDPPTENHQVNHIDGEKTNNRIENLEWTTRLENMQHASKLNLCPYGEQHPDAKLKNSDIPVIRQLMNDKTTNVSALARHYGVDRRQLYYIKHQQTWKKIK